MSEQKGSRKKNDKPKEPLLKILMLHGYRQSEAAFRERSGGLRKYLRNHAEFIFCEAPHVIPKREQDSGPSTDEIEKGWWFSAADRSYTLDVTSCDDGFSETLKYINGIFETQGPFDGIFGFSQGGCLAGVLCKIASNQDSQFEYIRFNFAIIVAGFKSFQTQHEIFYNLNNKTNLPTLHVIGNADQVISREAATNLTNYFLDPKIFYHEAGHFIPVTAESKVAFVDFLSPIKPKLS